MDKENKISNSDNRIAELEKKFKEFENKEQKYKDELYDLHLHRIDQIITDITNVVGSNSFWYENVQKIAKYFFNKGVLFGKGEQITFSYSKKTGLI